MFVPLCYTIPSATISASGSRHSFLAAITKTPFWSISSHAHYTSSPHSPLLFCVTTFRSHLGLCGVVSLLVSGIVSNQYHNALPASQSSTWRSCFHFTLCMLHRRLSGVTPLSIHRRNFAIPFPFHCACKYNLSFSRSYDEDVIPLFFVLGTFLRCHLPFLTPPRNIGILIRRLAKIPPFRTYRCIRRSPYAIELRVADE